MTRRLGPFLLLLLAYVVVGLHFTHRGVIVGDALSRTVGAELAIAGRDPHLGAIGFVFNPLPTVLEIPLVALRGLLPSLLSSGDAGVLMSAAFATGAVWHAHRFVLERGDGPRWALLVAAAIALHPLSVIYAGNGMSEAPFVCCLVAAVRHLSRWQTTDRGRDLALAGTWLGLGYLVRYEALVAAAGALLVVAVTTVARRRTTGGVRHRVVLDGLLLAGPVVFAFASLTSLSWWLTGEAFPQFASVYGNRSIVSVSTGGLVPEQIAETVTRQVLGLAPALPLALVVVGALALSRRDLSLLVPFGVLGSVLVFECVSITSGTTFAFLRYFLLVVPLVALSMVQLRAWGRVGAGLAVALAVSGAVGGWLVTSGERYAPQEAVYHQALPWRQATEAELSSLQLDVAREVSAWLDERTGEGSTALMDIVYGFAVVSQAQRPESLVLPPDRDFSTAVEDPWGNGIRYVVAVPPTGRGLLDAVNRYYPGLYAGCVRGTELVATFGSGGGEPQEWRVYRLLGPLTPATTERDGPCPEAEIRLP